MHVSRLAASALVGLALALLSGPPARAECPSPTLEQFGFNTRPIAPGVRPLLTILVDFTDARVNPARGRDYFQRLFFGTSSRGGGSASLNSMYYAASNGAVSFTNAGVVNVSYPGPGTPLPSDFDTQIARLAATAMRASGGRTLESFDRNGDRVIDNSELMIVRVSNSPVYRGLGATGWRDLRLGSGNPIIDATLAGPVGFLIPTGYRLRGHLSGVDEEMDLNGIAHEVLHAFGNNDHIYGPGFGLNAFGSFFAGAYDAASPPGAIALDPFTRMRSGWLRPRLVNINAPGSARLRHYGDSADGDTLLLFDQTRCDEFFLAEFRNPSRPLAAVDRGAGGAPGSAGIILWYVKLAADFSPYQFNWPPPIRGPFVAGAADHMVANYMVGPGGPAVFSNLIANTPEFSPAWGDGTPTNVGFEAFFDPASDVADLTWRRLGASFIARIDSINGVARPAPLSAGGPTQMVIEGQFPARPSGVVAHLISLGAPIPLFIAEYSATRIVLRTQGAVAPGPYQIQLSASAPRTIATRGNFRVTFR
jgi:M6 family metalloprotease-like protein